MPHRDDALPSHVSHVIERPSLLHSAALLMVTTIAGLAGLLLLYRATEPTVVSGTGASAPTAPLSAAASPFALPPELLTMAVAVTTALAPTPTPMPPTPTYAMSTAVSLPDVCLTSTPRGAVCSQPEPPLPPPTPMAFCPVLPGKPCVARGGPVRWVATSTPDGSTTDGSSS